MMMLATIAKPRDDAAPAMTINPLSSQKPFTTKDGSTIRSILDRTNAPVEMQSLAEATLPEGCATQRHYHKNSESVSGHTSPGW